MGMSELTPAFWNPTFDTEEEEEDTGEETAWITQQTSSSIATPSCHLMEKR